MKIFYECEYCKKQFDNKHQCAIHELSHLNGDESVRYYIRNIMGDELCDHCAHIYYVYNCEPDCVNKSCGPNNNYRDFKLKGV